jgi:two-component system response regulator
MRTKKPVRIILIEDNPGDVHLLERTLKSCDISYEITRYEDGEQAVQAMDRWHTLHPSLILLDLNLPRREGFDVLLRVRQRPTLVGVPVGVLTSSEATKDRHRIALIGAERYIHKPPFFDQFVHEVGNAIEDLLSQAPTH